MTREGAKRRGRVEEREFCRGHQVKIVLVLVVPFLLDAGLATSFGLARRQHRAIVVHVLAKGSAIVFEIGPYGHGRLDGVGKHKCAGPQQRKAAVMELQWELVTNTSY